LPLFALDGWDCGRSQCRDCWRWFGFDDGLGSGKEDRSGDGFDQGGGFCFERRSGVEAFAAADAFEEKFGDVFDGDVF
jgi:hypothetical protein